jgi:hypothetical protein
MGTFRRAYGRMRIGQPEDESFVFLEVLLDSNAMMLGDYEKKTFIGIFCYI